MWLKTIQSDWAISYLQETQPGLLGRDLFNRELLILLIKKGKKSKPDMIYARAERMIALFHGCFAAP